MPMLEPMTNDSRQAHPMRSVRGGQLMATHSRPMGGGQVQIPMGLDVQQFQHVGGAGIAGNSNPYGFEGGGMVNYGFYNAEDHGGHATGNVNVNQHGNLHPVQQMTQGNNRSSRGGMGSVASRQQRGGQGA